MRLTFYPEMTAPVEEEPEMPIEKQMGLFEGTEQEEEAEEEEE
jgi:hypothetical protein